VRISAATGALLNGEGYEHPCIVEADAVLSWIAVTFALAKPLRVRSDGMIVPPRDDKEEPS
jgi:hypothetical protein